MRIQALLAFNAAGIVVDAFEFSDAERRHCQTPRIVKKQMKARDDVVKVARITTRTLDGAGNV